MSKCKICKQKTQKIISFGKMPIANGFINKLKVKEFFFNLSLVFCPKCFMVQLGETIKPEMMFHKNYQFISSTSQSMELHFRKTAQEIIKKVAHRKNPFIVELGCNDGVMLKHLAKKNIKHLGVEPSSNVARLAKKNGVSVWVKFFNEETAKKIVKKFGQADIICGANVFCHIENINSVFEGINLLLKKEGIVFFEEPYIYDIIQKSSFDQIYDEHVYYYSGLSVSNLAKKHNLHLIKMRYQEVHGGSMRYYLSKSSPGGQISSLKNWLAKEKTSKLDKIEGYLGFKNKVVQICTDLKNLLRKFKNQQQKVIGYAATSKSTTLLNYAGIGSTLVKYISDTTPSKIGKYSPGMHIPIKSHKQFIKDRPPYTLLLAWNHKKEIFLKEKKYRQRGGKFITYFPKVVIE